MRDVPKEFEFPWENRHGVSLLVRARDSAEPANETINNKSFSTAPTNLVPRTLDIELPWLDNPDLHLVESSQTFDPETHDVYAVYVPMNWGESAPKNPGFYSVRLNTDTLNYDVQQILPTPTDGASLHSPRIRRSWTGELWLKIDQVYGFGNGYSRYFRCQPGGVWQEWDVEYIPSDWNGSLDHNGNPAFFWGDYSDVAYNRVKAYYKWWDETSKDWVYEFICDPGGDGITHVRPDGVVQVVMERDTDTVFGGSDGPIYGRIHERATDGTWSEVYQVEGMLWHQRDHYETWDSEWAWGASVIHADETVDQIVYGQNGYEILPGLKINDEYVIYNGKAYPNSSSFHLLTGYLTVSSNSFLQDFYSEEYGADILGTSLKVSQVFMSDYPSPYFDATNGYSTVIWFGPDFETNARALRIWVTPPGVSILDP